MRIRAKIRAEKSAKNRRKNGFTTIELMVVIFLIGLITAAVVMTLPGEGQKLTEQADRLALRLGAARDHAVLAARPVAVMADGQSYWLAVRRDKKWHNLDGKPFGKVALNGGASLSAEAVIAAPITSPAPYGDEHKPTPNNGQMGKVLLVFNPLGLPQKEQQLTISNGTEHRRITIDMSGKISRE